ncbi:MAG TPA: hypothetical protein DEF61_02665 [Firmicutes bacterium]|nr:hypothetical protein [Bacillota bacterium]HBM70278.1 hypothetical protein [Bacillota bacterium]HBX25167.1 hypothetical protein [Bacillota bacterium]
MKKGLGFISLSLLLFSCSTNKSMTTVENNESSVDSTRIDDSTSSSSFESSSQAKQIDLDKEKIEEFNQYLMDINGHPNKVNVSMNSSYNFSSGDEIDLEGSDIFEAMRYKRENASDIVIRKGTQIVENSKSDYQAQLFTDKNYFYTLVNDGNSKTKTSSIYIKSLEEEFFNISFGFTQIANLNYLKSVIENNNISYTLDLPHDYLLKGDISFSYSLSSLDQNKIKTKEIKHEITVTINNNVISKAKHITQTDLYAGGIKANWQRIESNYTYFEGEYELYKGEVFNPSEYLEQ